MTTRVTGKGRMTKRRRTSRTHVGEVGSWLPVFPSTRAKALSGKRCSKWNRIANGFETHEDSELHTENETEDESADGEQDRDHRLYYCVAPPIFF